MVTPRTCFTAVRQRDVAALLPRHFAEQPFIVWLVANFNARERFCTQPHCTCDTLYSTPSHQKRHYKDKHLDEELAKDEVRAIEMLLTVAQRETGVDFQMGWQLASAPVAPVPMIPSAVADQRVSRNVSSGLSSSQLSSPTAYSGNFDYGPNVMESTTDPLSNTSDEDVAALLATMPSTPNFSLLVTPYAMPAQTRGFGQHGVSGSNNADQPQERTHNSSHNVQAQPPATTINSGSYNSYNGYPHSVPQQEPTSGYAGQQQDEPYGRSTSQYSSQYHGNQRS